ncbi:MAG: phosphodiester glycosidase family protein [Clostridia bacterium]|nr:phosphodiester glycosidase family protein [Clostridia bacterium]
MRKLISILLLIPLLCATVFAEEAAPETTAPALTAAPLAIDPTVGANSADESGYILDENGNRIGYEDASLRITMETIEVENVIYRVARVEVADASQLRTGLEDPSRAKKSNYLHVIAQDYNAVLAISADQIVRNEKGYVIREGKTYRKKYYKSRDILAIDANGDFHIVYKSDEDAFEALLNNPECPIVNTFNFGPALVAEGQVLEMPSYYTQFNLGRPEPRCAIGQTGPLSYILVVVEGRSKESAGATGEQLASFMASQGCVTAYNLDGGDTAMMWFGGDYYSARTKRSQSDIIYFGSAVPVEE